ncbi:MAG: hypothetical protein RLW62_22365 [Gammaproteobacteria bacterium]
MVTRHASSIRAIPGVALQILRRQWGRHAAVALPRGAREMVRNVLGGLSVILQGAS